MVYVNKLKAIIGRAAYRWKGKGVICTLLDQLSKSYWVGGSKSSPREMRVHSPPLMQPWLIYAKGCKQVMKNILSWLRIPQEGLKQVTDMENNACTSQIHFVQSHNKVNYGDVSTLHTVGYQQVFSVLFMAFLSTLFLPESFYSTCIVH